MMLISRDTFMRFLRNRSSSFDNTIVEELNAGEYVGVITNDKDASQHRQLLLRDGRFVWADNGQDVLSINF